MKDFQTTQVHWCNVVGSAYDLKRQMPEPKVPCLIPGLATYFVSLSEEDRFKKGSCQLRAEVFVLSID